MAFVGTDTSLSFERFFLHCVPVGTLWPLSATAGAHAVRNRFSEV